MKKALAIFILALAGYANAETLTPGGTITAPVVKKKTSNNELVLATYLVDSNGNTISSLSISMAAGANVTVNNANATAVPVRLTGTSDVSITNTNSSAVPVRLTGNSDVNVVVGGAAISSSNPVPISGPANINGNVTIGGFVQLTSNAYAVVNNVVTTINLTSTAGYNGGKPVVAVLSGNGAFRWAQANSVTAPYYLTGTAGHYQAGSTTAIAVIEQATGGSNSPHLFVVGAGSNCDVWVGIQRKE